MADHDIKLFSEAEIELMTACFDAAWKTLSESGSIFAQPYQAENTREAIALKTIELVRPHASLDAAGLSDLVLEHLGFLPRSSRADDPDRADDSDSAQSDYLSAPPAVALRAGASA